VRNIHRVHKAGAIGATALVGLNLFNAIQGQVPSVELFWRLPVAAAFGYGLVFLPLYLLDRLPKAIRSVTQASPADARRRPNSPAPRDQNNPKG
jgi:hypothetical protein